VLYIQLLLFGACIGVMSGMLGIGGGIILVPGLILLFGFSQQEAQGTSLAALSMPIFAFAAVVYYKYGYVRIPATAAVAVGIMLGAYVGARLIPVVPIAWLRLAFGGLLFYLGCLFVFGPYLTRSTAALPFKPPKNIRCMRLRPAPSSVSTSLSRWSPASAQSTDCSRAAKDSALEFSAAAASVKARCSAPCRAITTPT